jgi:hypothetical protein
MSTLSKIVTRLLPLTLMVSMSLVFVACGDDGDGPGSSNNNLQPDASTSDTGVDTGAEDGGGADGGGTDGGGTDGGGTDGGDDACSANNPTGACPSGETCYRGNCRDDGLFCSQARPSGLCSIEGDVCLDGACVDEDDVCSSENTNGLCSGTLQCINGQCAVDEPCASDTPQGYCPEGESCVDGTCIDDDDRCSDSNPTGDCPQDERCLEGTCVDEDTFCSSENPNGECPGDEDCVNGQCVDPNNTQCSASNPTGSCPGDETCQGGVCVADSAPASCHDGVQNELETDVDCGGPRCAACSTGQSCDQDTDCSTLSCDSTCEPAVPSFEVDEDFETGDFSKFPYVLEGDLADPNHWTIEDDAAQCHQGDHCMRTSVFHEHDETTAVTLSLSVRQDTTVSFWVKTNTEPGEHFFRFYVDDDLKEEISGQNDWTQITADVPATGPGGPDRVLKWEYYRSDFLDPNHSPWNEVWVDDIDMPEWNTAPTVPVLQEPGNGQVVTTDQPTMRWRSYDPDFDRIIYEVEYDTDPAFSNPVSTGETFDFLMTPSQALDDDTVYYWRARSKDDIDYRWSDWSDVSTFRVAVDDEYDRRWEQTLGSEFMLNDLDNLTLAGDTVVVDAAEHVETVSGSVSSSTQVDFDYSGLPQPQTGTSATVNFNGGVYRSRACTSCYSGSSAYSVYSNGGSVASLSVSATCTCSNTSGSVTLSNVDSLISGGSMDLQVRGGYSGSCYSYSEWVCSSWTAQLRYDTASTGTMTSVPIYFDSFDAKQNWEKLYVDADDGVTVQVLDGNGDLIPDAQVPGNSQGLTPGTHFLWHLDPADYSVIHLRANMEDDQELRTWQVFANDGFKWHFGNDGEAENWEVLDDGATPTVDVLDGVLYFDSLASGDNPRMVYTFPQAVAADRFDEIVVRLKTSNDTADDTVTLYWENNFGFFDPVRTFEETLFLATFKEVDFDLTVQPNAPQQPWQGDIDAIRVDPVDHFFDAAGDPDDGWVEVDYIWLR